MTRFREHERLPELMHASHLQALRDEEVGVRHRIQQYYLPLFFRHAQTTGDSPSMMRILDCGCGNGASVEFLAAAGFEAYGIDIAGFRAEQWVSRSRLPGVHLLAADATSLPFPDKYFDIVFSCGMLEHIGVAEVCTPEYRVTPLPTQAELRRSFMRESMRVLKPEGVLYLDHPNGSFPIDFWHNDFRSLPRWHWPGERFLPTFNQVKEMARAVVPHCSVEAIAPAGRFTFRRSGRHWYGKLLGGAVSMYLNLLGYRQFSSLAASPLNPYLVIRVAPAGTSRNQQPEEALRTFNDAARSASPDILAQRGEHSLKFEIDEGRAGAWRALGDTKKAASYDQQAVQDLLPQNY